MMTELSRREVLHSIGLLCCGALIFPLSVGCSSPKQINLQDEANVLTLPIDTFEGETIIIHSKKLAFPIALSRQDDGKLTAVLMQCTHKGCELRAEGAYLVCPCHGSEFDSQGKVISPPADKPLRTLPIRTVEKNIYIDIS